MGGGSRPRAAPTVIGRFGWMKDRGWIRKLLHRGLDKVAAVFILSCACYNLVRLRTLLAEPALGWGEAGR